VGRSKTPRRPGPTVRPLCALNGAKDQTLMQRHILVKLIRTSSSGQPLTT